MAYKPSKLYPDGISLDMSVNQTFSCLVNLSSGYLTNYKIIIYNSATNAELYNSGFVTLGSPKYNGDTLSATVTGGTTANGLNLKWTMAYTDNLSSSVTSYEYTFKSAADPVFTISVPTTVTTQSYAFNGTYTQAQNIALKEWHYEFYDSTNELLLELPISYSGNITYTYEGFISGNTYKVKGFGETQERQLVETPLYTFDVSYTQPNVLINPTAELLPELTAVRVSLGAIQQVSGVVSGTYSYVDDFVAVNNTGLQLNSGAVLSYSGLSIPNLHTGHQLFKFPNTGSRVIGKVSNTASGEYLAYGHNGTSFYKEINGTVLTGLNRLINVNYYYIFVVQFNKLVIYEFGADASTLITKETI